MARQPEPLTGSDRYGGEVDLNWLEGESIASVVWSNPGLDRTEELIQGNVITARFELSAGEDYGNKTVTMDVSTDAVPPRTKCFYMVIQAAECQG